MTNGCGPLPCGRYKCRWPLGPAGGFAWIICDLLDKRLDLDGKRLIHHIRACPGLFHIPDVRLEFVLRAASLHETQKSCKTRDWDSNCYQSTKGLEPFHSRISCLVDPVRMGFFHGGPGFLR